MILIGSTNQAAGIIRPLELLDKPIRQGQLAPYSGVLVPPYHYQQLSSSLQTLPICEDSLKESIQSGSSFGDQVIVFGFGALFGALTYITLHH